MKDSEPLESEFQNNLSHIFVSIVLIFFNRQQIQQKKVLEILPHKSLIEKNTFFSAHSLRNWFLGRFVSNLTKIAMLKDIQMLILKYIIDQYLFQRCQNKRFEYNKFSLQDYV